MVWYGSIGDWTNVGCQLVIAEQIICKCNHLTNFAILVVSGVCTMLAAYYHDIFRTLNHGLIINQVMSLDLRSSLTSAPFSPLLGY